MKQENEKCGDPVLALAPPAVTQLAVLPGSQAAPDVAAGSWWSMEIKVPLLQRPRCVLDINKPSQTHPALPDSVWVCTPRSPATARACSEPWGAAGLLLRHGEVLPGSPFSSCTGMTQNIIFFVLPSISLLPFHGLFPASNFADTILRARSTKTCR